VTIRKDLTVEEIVGRALSMSSCSPQTLGAQQQAFETRLAAALRELSPDGTFTEVAELVGGFWPGGQQDVSVFGGTSCCNRS